MEDVIVWEAPARCPGPAVVRATVARLLRASSDRPSFRAEARVDDGGDQLTLRLLVEVGEATGERTLTGPSCDALADAAATIIALAVDPEGVARLPTPPPATVAPLVLVPPPAPSAPPSASAPVVPPPAPAPAPAAAYGGSAGPLVALEAGLLPSVLPVFGASGSLRRGTFAFVLWGAAGPSQRIAAAGGAGANVSLGALGLSGCQQLFGSPVGVCAGVSGVRIAGTGFGPGVTPRADSTVLVRVELGTETVLRRGFVGLRLAAFFTVPTQRQAFVFGAGEELFRPSVVGGRAELSPFLQF